jgi:hypothetical protein
MLPTPDHPVPRISLSLSLSLSLTHSLSLSLSLSLTLPLTPPPPPSVSPSVRDNTHSIMAPCAFAKPHHGALRRTGHVEVYII